MQDNLRLLSDRSDRTKLTPTNLLDELSVKIKSGATTAKHLVIVYVDDDGQLTTMSTPMPRYHAVGMLEWGANMEMNDHE